MACSFFATTLPWDPADFQHVNEFMGRRGPDGTRCAQLRGLTACHNLLSMTGAVVPQPFISDAGDVLAVYNGEIYNYKDLEAELGLEFKSDGESVLPIYAKHGPTFPRWLDGEFAIALFDFSANIAVLAADIFSTKPLWFSRHGGLRVASYRSGVERLGAPPETIKMVDPNTVLVFDLREPPAGGPAPLLRRFALHEFDLRQFKVDVNDFLAAFQRAVVKRMVSNHPLFIGLSSGYDSGAIQVALKLAGQAHAAYTIFSTEDMSTLEKRIAWAGDLVDPNIIVLSEPDRANEEAFLRRHCEPFAFSGLGRQGFLVDDPASHGLSYILREVRRKRMLVYLSGTGADEIISDYGFGGKKLFPHSSFGGLFPEDLATIFPWPSFFVGTQRDYLMKEELVSGTHGVEGRYPFLDRAVVQEYLWLAPEVKNSRYKAPLHALLEAAGYPFIAGEKVGFNADWNVRDGGESVFLTRGDGGRLRVREVAPEPEGKADVVAEADLQGQEEELQKQVQELVAREAAARRAWREGELVRKQLLAREVALAAAVEEFDAERVQRIQMYLFVMLPRLAQMRTATATAVAGPGTGAAAERPPTAADAEPVHPRWQAVEVVTCVSGGMHVVVADFPVYEIFRATTPLPVHNICEQVEWEGMHFRLRAYARFLRERPQPEPGRLPTLYYVSDGLDVFFNDIGEVLGATTPEDKVDRGARATARLIAERYEAIARGGEGGRWRPIVASTERLCGWGGAKLCSVEDEARYPESPTDSKYFNAGGYIGPADALSRMVEAVLRLKEGAAGEEKEKARDSDQYFFKRYFWDHQEDIALDYHQSIFGNFLEVVNRPCENDWVPLCAVRPCCTESDDFRNFHKIFYERYKVRGCAVWRRDNLPVSWHGNGAGKWLYLLSLDRLAMQCPVVANLTLARYPDEMVRGVFNKFQHRAAVEGAKWPGGFLLRQAVTPSKAPAQRLPECDAG